MEITENVIEYFRLYTLTDSCEEDIQTLNPDIILDIIKSRQIDHVYLDLGKHNIPKEKTIVCTKYKFNINDLIFLEKYCIKNLTKNKICYSDLLNIIDCFN